MFGPDSRLVAVTGSGRDGTVRLWDPFTGADLGRLVGYRGRRLEVPGLDPGGPMAFSPSGDRLALAVRDDGAARRFGVRLFDLVPARP